MGKVIHIDGAGTGGSGTGYLTVQANYTDLITAFPTAPTMSLAYVQNSQGTAWLPGNMGGTFYSKGTYLFDGANWVSSVDDIAKELQDILDNMNTQNLESVLSNGIFTGAYNISINDNQIITASNGNSKINLREGADGIIKISGGEVDANWNGSSFEVNAGDFLTQPSFSRMVLSPLVSGFSMIKSTFTKFGDFNMYNNDAGDVSGANLPNYISSISSQNPTIKQNVINSTVNGGLNVIVKTDNTDYSTQNGYNTGTAGELIVKHTPSATDYTQTHQADNGDIALTKNIAISQAYIIQTIITAPTITSDQDNYSPVGFDDDTDLIRVDIDANNRSISGIPAPPLGVFRILGIKNTNTTSLDLRFEHNNAGSLPQNRFLCRDNTRKSIKPNEMALWFYDHNVQRWTPFNRIG